MRARRLRRLATTTPRSWTSHLTRCARSPRWLRGRASRALKQQRWVIVYNFSAPENIGKCTFSHFSYKVNHLNVTCNVQIGVSFNHVIKTLADRQLLVERSLFNSRFLGVPMGHWYQMWVPINQQILHFLCVQKIG